MMNDIEDILQDKSLINFVKHLSYSTFNSEEEYKAAYNISKKKYKICPSKPTIRKVYNYLLSSNQIIPNQSFLDYTLKKRSRSSSGVSP